MKLLTLLLWDTGLSYTIKDMSWVTSSIFMFVSSIVFYLSVKKLQTLGVDKRIYTLANFLFPTVIFFGIAVTNQMPLIYSFFLLVSLIILRAVLNYVGTIAGYKSMEEAPNAGYSLMIQKGYAVYTLFAAVVLYGSEVSVSKFLISGFVLGCAALIAWERGKKLSRVNYRWVLYAIVAMFCFGTIALSGKFFVQQGIAAVPQLFWVCLATLFLTGADMARVRTRRQRMDARMWLLVGLLGVSVSGFYYFKLAAEIAAPNLGYVGTINAASNAVYTVLVAWLFGDHLSWKKLAAVGGMTAGIGLLLFS